jgi:hypothetical protein
MKIATENAAKIEKMLLEINGRKVEHVLTKAYDVEQIAQDAQAALDDLVAMKKNQNGAIYTYMSGGKVPSAYKYARIVTQLTIVKKSTGWHIQHVCNFSTHAKVARKGYITLTPAQEVIAIADFKKSFAVSNVFGFTAADYQ